MTKSNFRFTLTLVAIFVCSLNFAQKKFKVTLKWPAGLVTEKMQVFYHNGIKGSLIDAVPTKN